MEVFKIQFGGVPWHSAPVIKKQYKDFDTAINICKRLSRLSGVVIRLRKGNSLQGHYIKPNNYTYQKGI